MTRGKLQDVGLLLERTGFSSTATNREVDINMIPLPTSNPPSSSSLISAACELVDERYVAAVSSMIAINKEMVLENFLTSVLVGLD